jgi:hypothetical protein
LQKAAGSRFYFAGCLQRSTQTLIKMKAYGYAKKQVTPQGLYEMSEVTFTGASSSIREIARFLLAAADEMDRRGGQFSHSHIREHFPEWHERWPDVIVARGGRC